MPAHTCRIAEIMENQLIMVRVRYLLIFAFFALLSQGCATTVGETIKIDQRQVVAPQNRPAELTAMLRDLGYDWIPILDPINQQMVKAVEQDGGYRMLFEYLKTRQVHIEVQTNWRGGFTRLHFYEPGSKTLSASSRELLQQLQQRVALQFGEASVSH